METMDPMKAPKISVMDPAVTPRLSSPIITRDTTSFAPEDIPRTKGPAMGLAKKV